MKRREIALMLGGAGLALCIGGCLFYGVLSKEREAVSFLQGELAVAQETVALQQNTISNLEETVQAAAGMEFKFEYPTGMKLDVVTALEQQEGQWVANIKVNGIEAKASMAKDFKITGSKYSLNLVDFDLLARTVSAETGGMSERANIATANVIFHRLDSERYPNSIYGVVHQPYQFEVVEVGTYKEAPTEKAIGATVQAMNGVDVVPTAMGFWNAKYVRRSHPIWDYPIQYTIDEHVYSTLQK